MASDIPADDDEARYLALKARDARFDGRFFTGVTSTGIYCRPVCAVRTPRRENCRFFALAAQAESAGFRPCLRCRPELAPQALVWSLQDASGILVRQALRLLDAPEAWSEPGGAPLVARLAARLGISDRHLRRIFEAALGISPLQYLQTRRLLTAKQLLTDTRLPVTQVALASGFASVRRFNAAFGAHYGLNPTRLRGQGVANQVTQDSTHPVRLGYRPPFDVQALLNFFAARRIQGLEEVEGLALRRTVQLNSSGTMSTGWLEARFDPARVQLLLQVSDELQGALPQVIARVRALLDLDADPAAINAVLHPFFPQGDGLRVPGALDGFELAVRAVLGQQITVAAARTLAERLVVQFGAPIATPWPGLDRLFPTPAALAAADGDALGRLGIVRQRQAAIVALARAVDGGQLHLHASADVDATVATLRQLPGIGNWTAQYIAMRALRWPDAFPAGDVALHKALGVQGRPQPARMATDAAQAWRPWRSYGVIRAWSSLP
ncbi:MAG: helix-turn-helix domain-containing protein [Proteobacteria bacterium]|nr:helix-turn-helix domain-containing protein [Pseudomonadota bacterium]MBS0492376.1 helix-turn-helix domain-containing protein [Pseudomonadota bacterium]